MERMEEEIDSAEYRRYQHLLTHSKGVMKGWEFEALSDPENELVTRMEMFKERSPEILQN